ncbi:MAG: hypothetical protein ACTHM1_07135 [Solirubrobacteraceae bacterium]
MSEPLDDEAEVIDGIPVLPQEPALAGAPTAGAIGDAGGRSRALAVRLPAPVQAAVAALGGVLAGAAIVGLVRRRARHRPGALARRSPIRVLRRGTSRGRRGAASELVQVVASRSLLVDVHLLGSRTQDRRR